MRMHIELNPRILEDIDRLAGPRGRSRFIRAAIETALERHRRAALIRSALGTITSEGHPWDEDPAGWVTAERQADETRVG
jgi:hypothetical protein